MYLTNTDAIAKKSQHWAIVSGPFSMKRCSLLPIFLFSFFPMHVCSTVEDLQKIIQNYISSGQDLNTVVAECKNSSFMKDRITLLHLAILIPDDATIDLLLQHGANPSVCDESGSNCLHVAIQEKHNKLAYRFIDMGTPFDERCIQSAAASNNLEMLKYAVEHGFIVNHFKNEKEPALHIAAFHGALEAVQFLVEQGADVNEYAESASMAPFLCAVKSNNPKILEYLFQQGADIRAESPLLKNNNLLTCKQLCNAIDLAVYFDALDSVKWLLAHGFSINRTNEYGISLLHWAAVRCSPELIDFLLQEGLDINQRDSSIGMTPLHCAVFNERIESMRLLIDRGADIHARNACGQTALLIASQANIAPLVDLLLAQGASPLVRDIMHKTPLDYARENKNTSTAKHLLFHTQPRKKTQKCPYCFPATTA